MKNLFLLLLFSLSLSCEHKKQETKDRPTADTSVEFRQTTYNFGDLSEGEIVSHSFHFKNTGKENFLIRKVDSGCGCTSVNYEKAPIAPGKEGKVEITFNSSGRYGKQYKEISIFANVPQKEIKLKFTANIK